MDKELTYEEAVRELEDISEKIENQEVSVDELSEKLERASVLINFCRAKLLKTEKEVDLLLKGFEQSDEEL